jgi:hypothetical protein
MELDLSIDQYEEGNQCLLDESKDLADNNFDDGSMRMSQPLNPINPKSLTSDN